MDYLLFVLINNILILKLSYIKDTLNNNHHRPLKKTYYRRYKKKVFFTASKQ